MSIIYLPELPARLRELTGCSEGPEYARLYRLCIAGRLPATREHGRFFVDSADLGEIARRLGLTEPAPPSGKVRRTQPTAA